MDLGKFNKDLRSYDFDFFISYSTLDREFSHKLLYELEKNGFKCWIAPRDIIGSSRPYATEIKEAIVFSRFFILLFSKNYMASKYTYHELKLALEFNKDIFAINIDSSTIDEEFSDLLKNATWVNELDEILLNPLVKSNNFFDGEKLSSRIEQKIFEFKNKDDYTLQNKKTKNFKYLDDLIHSGVKEIVLDSDILLSDGEESEYLKGIKLDVDNLIIDGNGHTIDANGKTGIFECNGENILIKNITFKRSSERAIYNYNGILTITESIFNENVQQHNEIIINGYGCSLTITESIFNNNISSARQGLIFNGGDLKIFNSEILNNESEYIIYNKGSLQVFNSKFNDNCARIMLYNEANDIFSDFYDYLSKHENTIGFESDLIIAEGNLSIIGCKFINNMCQSIIVNLGKFCSIGKSIFESNISSGNIFNFFDLILINPKIKDEGKTIFNVGNIIIKNSSPNILNQIVNEGTINVDSDMIPGEEKFDFSYLDKKIHESTIVHDIKNYKIL